MGNEQQDVYKRQLDLGGVDRIMFDNFTPEMTKKAVEMVAGKYETESSGGITFDTVSYTHLDVYKRQVLIIW